MSGSQQGSLDRRIAAETFANGAKHSWASIPASRFPCPSADACWKLVNLLQVQASSRHPTTKLLNPKLLKGAQRDLQIGMMVRSNDGTVCSEGLMLVKVVAVVGVGVMCGGGLRCYRCKAEGL